jgi:hypothetical protein
MNPNTLPTTPGAILGYRKNGAPIRLMAGGSGEGGDLPANDPAQGNPPADPPKNDPPADPPAGDKGTGDGTDWKAEARKWEQRAKDNHKAAAELDKLRKSSMTDQEKAVAEAEQRGRTAAALESGKRLASAELRAAAAAKGVDLSTIGELLDVGRFVDESGEVDTTAIGKAVDKLAKLTPAAPAKPAPPRGSGDFPGGTGAGAPITEEQLAQMSPDEIAAAMDAGKLKHLL